MNSKDERKKSECCISSERIANQNNDNEFVCHGCGECYQKDEKDMWVIIPTNEKEKMSRLNILHRMRASCLLSI